MQGTLQAKRYEWGSDDNSSSTTVEDIVAGCPDTRVDVIDTRLGPTSSKP